MIVVLIGSPMSGKTTLLKKLQERNIPVFQADSFITTIYKKGQIGYEVIKDRLGEEFVNEESVNKRLLAEWATDEENLKLLNELIHPLIKSYLDGKDNFVCELPIITSSSVKFNYDKIVLVKADDEVIEDRFSERNFQNEIFIKKIIEDWKNIEIVPDLIIDTTYNIKDEHIDRVIELLNEQ